MGRRLERGCCCVESRPKLDADGVWQQYERQARVCGGVLWEEEECDKDAGEDAVDEDENENGKKDQSCCGADGEGARADEEGEAEEEEEEEEDDGVGRLDGDETMAANALSSVI